MSVILDLFGGLLRHAIGRTGTERIIIIGLLGLALAARLVPGPRIVDDAYITYRYANNLLEGHGFVYNPGEHVLGTTTPLYACLLAGLAFITGWRDFPTLSMTVNALAGTLAVLTLYHLARDFSGRRIVGGGVALLWAVAPYGVTFTIGGMETELTIVLLLAASLAHLKGRHLAMAALSALAFLARPDTVLLSGLLWLDLILTRRRIPWREAGIALVLLAPWLVFGLLYFGSPFPHSVAAKTVAYRLPPEAAFVRLLQHYATPFFEQNVLSPTGVFVVFAMYCALCVIGGIYAFRRNPRVWPLIAYPFVYFAVFALANPLLFRWYLSPPVPFYFLLIVMGGWRLIHDVVGALISQKSASAGRLVFSLFVLVALALTLNAWSLRPDHGPARPAPDMAWFKLELLYARAADIVRQHAGPGDTLGAGDIGVLGYRTGMRVLDTVGLITPETTRYYPADPAIYVINYAIPADLMLALDPDYIVILEVYGRRGLLPDPEFQSRYRLLAKLETDIYGSDGMLIYGRR
ncbi:MAG: hypothetical protein Kow0063_22830 [Anaerolineae bacterium]